MSETLSRPIFASELSPSSLRDSVRSRWVAERHFTYEKTNLVDQVMLSMASRGPLTTSIFAWDGPGQPPRIEICRTQSEQWDMYFKKRKVQQIADAQIFTAFGTDWYGYVHGIITTRNPATGELTPVEGIGILPVSRTEDAISGEIAFGRRVPSATEEPPEAAVKKRLHAHRVQTARVAALQKRDFAALGALYAEGVKAAVRPYPGEYQVSLEGRAGIVSFHRGLIESLSEVSIDVVMRLVEPWFTLLELGWEGRRSDGARLRFRTADLTTFDSKGLIDVQVGWGSEAEAFARK